MVLKTVEEKKRRKAETHKKWAIKNRVRRRKYAREYLKRNPLKVTTRLVGNENIIFTK